MTVTAPTFTIFSDADIPGWAEAFAALLGEGEPADVGVASTLDAAFDATSDVLILNLQHRREDILPAERIETLGRRRIVAMAPGADWIFDQVDELELHGGNITDNLPLVTCDSELLGRWTSAAEIDPFAEVRDIPWPERTARTPCVYFGAGSMADYRPGVDYIAGAGNFDRCAVVMRQANWVFAGVKAHPEEWSSAYRELMRRTCFALARRPVLNLEPIIVERQLLPPGTIEFELDTGDADERTFYLRFDRPTAFTATLEHTGSNAMMLLFYGGKKRLHWTREDTATSGQTLTIAANIGDAAIEGIGHRYWVLTVWNYDRENTASVRLTVAYGTDESEPAIRPLPGNASFEYLCRSALELNRRARAGDESALARIATHAPSLDAESPATARVATAREHGFETWEIVAGHVAWQVVFLGNGGEFGARDFFERGRARYRDSFSLNELVEYAGDFSDDLNATLTDAFARASAAGHREFTGVHLLLALLDNPVSVHVLKSVGGDVEGLRVDLAARLNDVETGGSTDEVQVSRALCGAVYRANFITVLGREGTHAANLLAGLYGEKGPAADLLVARGAKEQDVVNYVAHGVPSTDVDARDPGASVFDADVEKAARDAFSNARGARHQHLAVEQLLLALLDRAGPRDALASIGVEVDKMRRELADLIDEAIPLLTADDVEPAPTRAFNRVMQTTVAKARRSGRGEANAVDALWALCGERDAPLAEVLGRHNVDRSQLEVEPGTAKSR